MKNVKLIIIYSILMLIFGPAFAESDISEPTQAPGAKFRLFRTRNVWTFIKLDTVTAKMWIVQFDIAGNNRMTLVLSNRDLAKGKVHVPGRFTLYPTMNVWNFILVDQMDGTTWQVQWSTNPENRLVIPIELKIE